MVFADTAAVVDLLTRGFSARGRGYWEQAIAVMSERAVPRSCPRYGYVLTSDQRIVGVILLIFFIPEGQDAPRCNISSWYVEPSFRTYASWLISTALKNKLATYVNLSAAPHTRQTILAQGFACYAKGVYLGVPALVWPVRKTQMRVIHANEGGSDQIELLADHARYGCLSLVLSEDDRSYPFIFLRRTVPRTIIPCAQLIYAGDRADVVRFAGTLGRYLLARGLPLLMMDANAPVEGLPGRYLEGRSPKYCRGPLPPRLGDLSYGEAVLFGP